MLTDAKAVRHRRLAAFILSALAMATFIRVTHVQAQAREEAAYVDPKTCAVCHRELWDNYQQTGMGRSFYRPSAANTVEDYSQKNTYYHQASDSYFTMLRRDGKFYQRRYQVDSAGKQINLMEKQIDYILGSGNHARTYLHRTARNTLVELPLGWYTEKGGYWAMNPGYDRPNHDGFRRPITYDCMFCHNGYPEIPAGHDQPFAEPVYTSSLPEGIDCQRCHGPGSRHARLATAGASSNMIRAAIVNPARLDGQRQMEVCMACHLESTSFPLPNAIERYERGPFSYRPGEPLSSFILNFDHAPGTGHDDKFEIVNAVYRLRRSACFLKSNGKLSCTTCHNPHDIPRGEAASRHYTTVCRQCHAAGFDKLVAAGKHTPAAGCIDCHMPKRRTEDVVHSAATDHYIQRHQPAGNLLAERPERHETGAEAYRGPVVLYYPPTLPHTVENDLYLAIAQVNQGSNLKEGIVQLTAALNRYSPRRAEYYFELAEALRDDGQLSKALPVYRETLRRNPKFAVGMQKFGNALRRSGQYVEAADVLRRATSLSPDRPAAWQELGLVYRAQGKNRDAVAALQRAVALEPDFSEAHNNLGVISSSDGDRPRAEAAFREAIRIQPDYADAHGNLGNLLSAAGVFDEARVHFEVALRLRPDDAVTRYNYAMVLGRTQHFDEAQHELEESLKSDPALVDAHLLLGDLLMAKGQAQTALPHYREAARLQPALGRAHLGLGAALATVGDRAAATVELRKAATDTDPEIRAQAEQLLRQ